MKHAFILALVAALVLLIAAPALADVGPTGPATQGYRVTFTKTSTCEACHDGNFQGAPPVYNDWVTTKHGTTITDGQQARGPESYCAGCHTSNYDPTKTSPSPSPSGTTTAWVYPYTTDVPTDPASPYPFSEADVGCSSCHYGANPGDLAHPASAAHGAPIANLANADICGQCHSRYSYSTTVFHVNPTPTPGAPTDSIVQLQNATDWPMLGLAATTWIPTSLSNALNLPEPDWMTTATPTPVPSTAATPAAPGKPGNVQAYWMNSDGTTVYPWVQKGHEGDAVQYPEWNLSAHADSLANLKAFVPNAPQSCLKCHSADYQIESALNPSASPSALPDINSAKYGDTCVTCHTPHTPGKTNGAWTDEFDTQLVGNPDNPSDLCITCHTAQNASETEDLSASLPAAPGQEVHNATKQIMNGAGAIDVAQDPGVHKGKCVQCHMVPTTYSRGAVQLGANHTMQIVDPEVAAKVSPFPVSTTTPTPSGSPVVNYAPMPYSACSTCHGRSSDPLATYLQATIEQRQASMHDWYDQVESTLETAAGKLGFKPTPATSSAPAVSAMTNANTALNNLKSNGYAWNSSQLNFQKAFTNAGFVESEGSWGIHNWNYAKSIVQTAQNEANAVSTITVVTIKSSASSIKVNKTVTISGVVSVANSGSVTIQKKKGSGSWAKATTATIGKNGKFSKGIKMTKKGTYYFRVQLAAGAGYNAATSAQVKVVVK